MAKALYLNKLTVPLPINTVDLSGKLPSTLMVPAGEAFIGDTHDPLVVSALASGFISLVQADPGNFLAGITAGTDCSDAIGVLLAKLAAGPTTLAYVSGDGQSQTAGTVSPTPLVVKVTDASGNPVDGIPVLWATTGGGGGTSAASSTTNASGLAQVGITLGGTPGANTFTASAYGAAGALSGSPVVFTATGT